MEVYTLDEAAAKLQLSRRTLCNYLKDGKLQGTKIGRFWRVSEEALADFLRQGSPILDSNRRKQK